MGSRGQRLPVPSPDPLPLPSHAVTQMHTHTPQGGNRWGSARGKGAWWGRKGWVRCVHMSVFLCLFILQHTGQSGMDSCTFSVRERAFLSGSCRTFARRVSPLWTGVGVSGVQTRFSSCCLPSSYPSLLSPSPPPP